MLLIPSIFINRPLTIDTEKPITLKGALLRDQPLHVSSILSLVETLGGVLVGAVSGSDH